MLILFCKKGVIVR